MALGSNLPAAVASGAGLWKDVILLIGLLGGAGAAAPGLFLLAFSGNNDWPERPWQWLCLVLGMGIALTLTFTGLILALR